jgi:UDP-N-acetylglucosamine--N-acetylmuramyl-(pentapeptide) pyrophosphoryl-undecaprenol N-acetylglucosamine transferase
MPALAIATALRAGDPSIEPVLVGAQRGLEATLLPERSFRYHLLQLEPIYRRQWWRNIRWPVMAWGLLRSVNRVLREERPVLAVGTGGYASGPVLFQAIRHGLPVALQEQNAYPGLVTRRLAHRARQIHLGFPEAAQHLRIGKTTVVSTFGNPIAPLPAPRPDAAEARRALGIDPTAPVVFVTGGSQGARRINEVVNEMVETDGLTDVVVLWGTGRGTWDVYRRHDRPGGVLVRPFWDPIAEAYAAADVVVARAGAMTTAELCAWGLPSVLIPLPSAAAGHQARNAEALAAAGAAEHLPESELSAGRLAAALRRLLDDPGALDRMRRAALGRGAPDAAEKIAASLLSLVS